MSATDNTLRVLKPHFDTILDALELYQGTMEHRSHTYGRTPHRGAAIDSAVEATLAIRKIRTQSTP